MPFTSCNNSTPTETQATTSTSATPSLGSKSPYRHGTYSKKSSNTTKGPPSCTEVPTATRFTKIRTNYKVVVETSVPRTTRGTNIAIAPPYYETHSYASATAPQETVETRRLLRPPRSDGEYVSINPIIPDELLEAATTGALL